MRKPQHGGASLWAGPLSLSLWVEWWAARSAYREPHQAALKFGARGRAAMACPGDMELPRIVGLEITGATVAGGLLQAPSVER